MSDLGPMNVKLNVYRAAVRAMSKRSDVSAKELNRYRALIARETTTLTTVHNAHGPHYCPSTICDCYYGLVS